MYLEHLVELARNSGASDLHLESGMPAAVRVRGELEAVGKPIPPTTVVTAARELFDRDQLAGFLEQRSFDLSRTIAGVRCRINVYQTSRGIGIAVRLLASIQPTLEHLNLHPDLKGLIEHNHGLVIVSGPTGSGKSSTLASLIHEVNSSKTLHMITIEHPIEYAFRPRRAYIQQREVGRDTPSFSQAIIDALREDPDVLLIGEVRTRRTMRLALMAAETGHLVFTTLHSSNTAEALQRLVSAFPPEIQESVAAQVADSLIAVVCQRMTYRPQQRVRVPECEILYATTAVKNLIRQRHFFKIRSVLDTSVKDGMWTYERYKDWLDARPRNAWYIPGKFDATTEQMPDVDPDALLAGWEAEAPATRGNARPAAPPSMAEIPERAPDPGELESAIVSGSEDEGEEVIDLEPVEEQNMDDLLSQLRPGDR